MTLRRCTKIRLVLVVPDCRIVFTVSEESKSPENHFEKHSEKSEILKRLNISMLDLSQLCLIA
jgi:hypothetical protein